jgi:ubiquinone/menaquinone biosynthesis C-methylase UbiE
MSSSPPGSLAPEIARQREYYSRTAQHYDESHLEGDPQHRVALGWLEGTVRQRGWTSVLDVGAGTGRTLSYLADSHPALRVVGIEPVEELRRVGYAKGISEDDLRAGDGTAIPAEDESFDVVCAFAVLHHVRQPEKVIREMLRVSRFAVFISDSNCFGQGSVVTRSIKQLSNRIGCWPLLDFLKTRGKGYSESDGDGIAYSYSVFMNERLLRESCREVYFLNTEPAGRNLYRSAGHVAVLAVK